MDNKLQRNVAPPTETKTSKLRKMFEQKNVEDNHIDKKTAPGIRKTTFTRKTQKQENNAQQQTIVPPQHLVQEEDQKNTPTYVRKKFMFGNFDESRRQPDSYILPGTVVPLDSEHVATAVHQASTTPVLRTATNFNSSKCLLPVSPIFEPQHAVDDIFCASQAEEPQVMTSLEKAVYHQ